MKEKNVLLRNIIWGILAIVAAAGLSCNMSFDDYYISVKNWNNYTSFGRMMVRIGRCLSQDRVLTGIIAAAIFVLLRKVCERKTTAADKAWAAVFAFAFSVMQLIGLGYKECGSWNMLFLNGFLTVRSLFHQTGMLILVYCLILLAFKGLDRFAQSEQEAAVLSRKRFITAAVLIFVCWLPYLVAFFPGTSNKDTAVGIAQFFGQETWALAKSSVRGDDIIFTNHFPFLTTLVYGSFIRIGLFFGNAAYGIALYNLIQMIFMSVTFTGVWFYLGYAGLSGKWMKAGLVFSALFPVYPMYAICVLKDTSFSMFCLIASVMICEIVRTKAEVLKNRLFCAALFLLSLAIMLVRSQGVYIMILVTAICLIIYRKEWKRIAVSLAVPVLLFEIVWMRMILPACNVAPGGRQEMLGTLFQQTARYVRDHGEDITEEEARVISRILDYDRLAELYDPELSDPVKFTFNQDCTDEEMSAYFRVWFQMFLKHPGCYVQAVLNNCYGYFYMPVEENLYYESYYNEKEWEGTELFIENSYLFEGTERTAAAMQTVLRRIPIVGLLFTMPFYSWLVLFFYINMLRRKDYGHLFTGFIILVSTGILLIAPDNANIRYSLPLMLPAPLLVGLCFIRPISVHTAKSITE